MTISELEQGYWKSYKDFYSFTNIWKSAMLQNSVSKKLSSLAYSIGWKKMEPLWELIIKTKKLQYTIPALELALKN